MGTGVDGVSVTQEQRGIKDGAILPAVSRRSGDTPPNEILGEAPHTPPLGVPRSPSIGAVWITYHPAAALYPGGTHLPVYIREDLRRSVDGVVSGVPSGEGGSRGVYDSVGLEAGLGLGPVGIGLGTEGIGLDTEWSPTGQLLTVGLANGEEAVAFETSATD